jgi:S-adenosylmethionine decarboxylase
MTLDLVEQKPTPPEAVEPIGAALEPMSKAGTGLHLIGDLYECAADVRYMVDADALRRRCLQLVREAGLTAAGDYFHQFGQPNVDAGGVTGMIVLMESHMSVHTWPEKGYVTVDVYVCNYSTDNRAKACKLFEGLLDTFRPADPRVVSVERA